MDAPILRFDRYNLPSGQASPAESLVWVEITRGRVRQRVRPVKGPAFLIGTAHDCDLVLGDPTFPEAFACLLVQEANVTIRRVGDGPELLVNGEVIESADLFKGDRLAFGPFELRINMRDCERLEKLDMPEVANGNWLLSGEFAEV